MELDRILLGDCLELMKGIPDKFVDLICTDPPYGISYQSNMKKNHDMPMFYDRNTYWLNEWLFHAHRLMKDDAHLYMFAPVQKIDEFKQKIESFFLVKNILVWNKGGFGMGDLKGSYAPSYEFIIFAVKEQGRKLNGKREPDILNYHKTKCELHPTQKPVDLLRHIISKSSNEGDVVLDPFSGSGSTAIAALKENRRFIGMELNEEFFNISLKRISNEYKNN